MLKTLLTGLVALTTLIAFDQEAFARYCNNPDCVMCNRIFGPMPGYSTRILGNIRSTYTPTFQAGNSGYPSNGSYTYDTPATTTTARYSWQKVCVNGVCSWQRVLAPSVIGRQRVYNSYPSSNAAVNGGSTGGYAAVNGGSTGSSSQSYGSAGGSSYNTPLSNLKNECNCTNCTCPNCGTKKTSENTESFTSFTKEVTPTIGNNREAEPVLEPSSQRAVNAMLKILQPKKGEWVYDLGSGDGRIVNTAAKDYGAKGVGIELNPDSVDLAIANAEKEGVSNDVTFLEGDARALDLSDADYVTMYLFPDLMEQLVKNVKPGTIVISYQHEIPGVKADKRVVEIDGVEHWFYVWRA